MQRSFRVVLVGLALVALGPASLEAEDRFYPGTECVRGVSTNQTGIYYVGTRAENNATQGHIYYCPMTTQEDDVFLDWLAFVKDEHPADGFSCFLQSCIDSTCFSSAVATTDDAAVGSYYLNLFTSNPIDLGTTIGAAYMICEVPGKYNGARSAIKMYLSVAN